MRNGGWSRCWLLVGGITGSLKLTQVEREGYSNEKVDGHTWLVEEERGRQMAPVPQLLTGNSVLLLRSGFMGKGRWWKRRGGSRIRCRGRGMRKR